MRRSAPYHSYAKANDSIPNQIRHEGVDRLSRAIENPDMEIQTGTKRRGRLTVDFGYELWEMIKAEAERRSNYNRVLPSELIREAVHSYLTDVQNSNAKLGDTANKSYLIDSED